MVTASSSLGGPAKGPPSRLRRRRAPAALVMAVGGAFALMFATLFVKLHGRTYTDAYYYDSLAYYGPFKPSAANESAAHDDDGDSGNNDAGGGANKRQKADLSVVVSTAGKRGKKRPNHDSLRALLESLRRQTSRKKFVIETIVVDNGCLPETDHNSTNRSYMFLARCDDYGLDSRLTRIATAEWLLFLSDDLVLQPGFLQHYFNLIAANHRNLAAIGCKLLNKEGTEVVEAGGIIWEDGTRTRYGGGRHDMNASDLSYPRPVDYVPGACLMINRTILQNNDGGGFRGFYDHKDFEHYNLQMHIQHNLGKEVWLQPQAAAMLAKHEPLVEFKGKWEKELLHHLPAFQQQPEKDTFNIGYLRASDLRARRKLAILYIDAFFPNPAMGAGFGRAYHNVQILSKDLGHMVTVTSPRLNNDYRCNNECRQSILLCGIELVETGSINALHEFMESRMGFYDVVLVSRPIVFYLVHDVLQRMFIKSHGRFAILYDSECLWYLRDEMMINLIQQKNISFPGRPKLSNNHHLWQHVIDSDRDLELSWIKMSDVVLTVSDSEAQIIKDHIADDGNGTGVTSFNVGLLSELDSSNQLPASDFSNRSGILFLGAFHGGMYYNGDAIWSFLKEIYPLILKEEPISLTIAGRHIPQQLQEFVKNESLISQHVTFLDSPESVEPLYKKTRMVVAPHLYVSGIQFKITEAWAFGVPAVMSLPAAESLGVKSESNVGCVGKNAESFKDCVISANKNETHWLLMRKNTFKYAAQNFDRGTLIRNLSGALDSANAMLKARIQREEQCEMNKADHCPSNLISFLMKDFEAPTEMCPAGEDMYLSANPDAADAVSAGKLKSGYAHFKKRGKVEPYRIYTCNITKIDTWRQCTESCIDMYRQHDIITTKVKTATKVCTEGEEIYLLQYPDVKDAVKAGKFASAFVHWQKHGFEQGQHYYCSL